MESGSAFVSRAREQVAWPPHRDMSQGRDGNESLGCPASSATHAWLCAPRVRAASETHVRHVGKDAVERES